jgi:hypothetical protein
VKKTLGEPLSMASKRELLQAYVDLWSYLGEPPGIVKMNLEGEYSVSEYTDTFDVGWQELPDLCRRETLIDIQEFQAVVEDENGRTDTDNDSRENVGKSDSPGWTPKVSDIDLAKGPIGPWSRISISIYLFQLYRRLGRPLRVADLATSTECSAEDVRDHFRSWEDAGDRAEVPVDNPSWPEAITQELQWLQSRTENDVKTFESLREVMEPSLDLLFPEWGGESAKLRSELTKIAEQPLLDYDPTQDIFSLGCEPSQGEATHDGKLPPTHYPQSLERERRIDRISVEIQKLEELCSAAEAQLRYGLKNEAGDTMDRLQSELNALKESMNVEILPRDLLLRHKAVNIRAESARELQREPRQLSYKKGKNDYKLTDQLRSLSETFGEAPRPVTAELCGDYPASAYIQQFGSWPEAIDAAGLEQIDEEARKRREYDRLTVINELVQLAQKFGRVPEYSEVGAHTDFSVTTATNRLGSWEDAAEIVRSIAEVNSETDNMKTRPTQKIQQSGEDIGVGRRLNNLDILEELKNEVRNG